MKCRVQALSIKLYQEFQEKYQHYNRNRSTAADELDEFGFARKRSEQGVYFTPEEWSLVRREILKRKAT